MVHLFARCAGDLVPDAVEIRIDIVVQDPKDADSEGGDIFIAPAIVTSRLGDIVRFAIQLDAELQLCGIEIELIRSYTELTAELTAEQLAPLQL